MTEGIVSALDRSLTATTDNGTTENLTGLIQTDAPINPGNSGGPLVNSSGLVVAMNTAVATSSQGNAPAENVGFAIAIDEIRSIVGQILARGACADRERRHSPGAPSCCRPVKWAGSAAKERL